MAPECFFVFRRREHLRDFTDIYVRLRRGKSSDLDSACLKEVGYVKIFEFHAMLNETKRYRASADGLLSINLKLTLVTFVRKGFLICVL